MKKELKVGIFQMKCSSNQQENKNKIEEKVNKFVNANIDLIVLQELHDNIYFCQTENIDNFELADKIPGTTSLFYSELAKKKTA
jgi:N-carbamoylputrescine amidase